MKPLWGAVLLALATSNCTVGPNYHLPAHAIANAPGVNGAFVNGREAAFAQDALPDFWWRLYDDSRLDSYVQEALTANTDLRAADANLRRATFAIREAQAAQTVRTSVLGSVRVTIAAAIARNYVTVCSANRSLAAAEHVVGIEQRTLDEVRRLFQGGRATAFDVTRAQTAVDQSSAAIPPIIAQRQAALYVLAALIRRRSDVRFAERSLAAATAAIGIETAQLYPDVSIGGALGFASPFSTIGAGSNFGGNIGPLVSWTFPNRSEAHARIAEAGAEAEAADARFDGTVLSALQQTETALNSYVREIDHNQQLRQARDSAATASGQASTLFHFGKTGILEVLSAEANLAIAETAVAASDEALADDQANVFLALGGGWEP